MVLVGVLLKQEYTAQHHIEHEDEPCAVADKKVEQVAHFL